MKRSFFVNSSQKPTTSQHVGNPSDNHQGPTPTDGQPKKSQGLPLTQGPKHKKSSRPIAGGTGIGPSPAHSHGPQSLFTPSDGNAFTRTPILAEELGSDTPTDFSECEQETHGRTSAYSPVLGQPSDASRIRLNEEDEAFINNQAYFSDQQRPEVRLRFQQYYQRHQRSPLKVERSKKPTKTGKIRKNAKVTQVTCIPCGKVESSLQNMARHQTTCLKLKGKYLCDQNTNDGLPCDRMYCNKEELSRHLRDDHEVYERLMKKPLRASTSQEIPSPSPGGNNFAQMITSPDKRSRIRTPTPPLRPFKKSRKDVDSRAVLISQLIEEEDSDDRLVDRIYHPIPQRNFLIPEATLMEPDQEPPNSTLKKTCEALLAALIPLCAMM